MSNEISKIKAPPCELCTFIVLSVEALPGETVLNSYKVSRENATNFLTVELIVIEVSVRKIIYIVSKFAKNFYDFNSALKSISIIQQYVFL